MSGGTKKNISNQLKTIHTIDEKHSELIEHYNIIETETIPNLLKEKELLKNNIRSLKSNVTAYMDAKDQIKDISEQIKKLKSEKNNTY